MPGNPTPPYGDIVLYQTEDGRTRVECRFAGLTAWKGGGAHKGDRLRSRRQFGEEAASIVRGKPLPP